MGKLLSNFRNSRFAYLYNLRDSRAKGRLMLLLSGGTNALASALTTGLFYTTFLVNNGINLVNISIISFIPYIASCFSIFSPTILEKLRKRKWILAAGRFGYYTFYMLGVSLVPVLVNRPQLKIIAFVAVVFLGHICSSISGSGYTSWHINFLPDEVRAEHFGIQTAVVNVCSLGFGLLFGFIADRTSGDAAVRLITVLRYVGYFIGFLDVVWLTIPEEFPYESAGVQRFRDVITKPVKNRKFMGIMLFMAAWTFFANLPAGVLNYYLLEDLHLKYTYIQVINLIYPAILFLFMIPCRRTIKKRGWIGTFCVGGLLIGFSYICYGFAAPNNYLIVYPIVRITQHCIDAHFTSTTYSNFPYINLPREDRTNYMSFYTLLVNAAAFLGVMGGTWVVGLWPDLRFSMLRTPIGSTQLLLMLEGVGLMGSTALLAVNRKKLTPGERENYG